MSQESIPSRTDHRHRTAVSKLLSTYGERAVSFVRALAFWLAIVAPVVLVGALLAGFGGDRPLLFGGLILASVVCTVVGHDHVPD